MELISRLPAQISGALALLSKARRVESREPSSSEIKIFENLKLDARKVNAKSCLKGDGGYLRDGKADYIYRVIG